MKMIINVDEDTHSNTVEMYNEIIHGIPLTEIKDKLDAAVDEKYTNNKLDGEKWSEWATGVMFAISVIDEYIGDYNACDCNTCIRNDERDSGECYECVKGIQNWYEQADGPCQIDMDEAWDQAKIQDNDEKHNVFYEQMPDDFTEAVETIMQYCQNEDCDDDCSCCPHPVSEIRCGDKDSNGTSIADSIRNMDNKTLAIYLHSWQVENMSVEQIKELLRQPLVDNEVIKEG